MKVVQTDKLDTFDDYAIVERDLPIPAEDQVLVRVAACGMGYVDALLARGGYQVKPQLPFVPGQETAGTVEAVGAAVSGVALGDRVMGLSFGGGLAQYVSLPETAVYRIPSTMTFAQAAVFRINYLTAMHALVDRARLAVGERLLVFGSAGGVGTAAVQLGVLLGAQVIAVASSADKRAFAAINGAQATIDTEAEGWRDRLKALTGGAGCDVIFDPVCGSLFEPAFRSLAWRGRHLVVGFAGGPIPKLPVNLPLMKGAALIGTDVRQFLEFEAGLAHGHLIRMLDWVGAGRLTPPVGRIFPLTAFRDAMTFALTGEGIGKAVIDMTEAHGACGHD